MTNGIRGWQRGDLRHVKRTRSFFSPGVYAWEPEVYGCLSAPFRGLLFRLQPPFGVHPVSHTFQQLYYHFAWSTSRREPLIDRSLETFETEEDDWPEGMIIGEGP